MMRVTAACAPSVERCGVAVAIDGHPARTIELKARFDDYELPVPSTALRDQTGPVDVRFYGPGADNGRNETADRSFRLASLALMPVGDPGRETVRHLFRPDTRPADLNLLSDEAKVEWNVRLQGFYPREPGFNWTGRRATIVVPIGRHRPNALHMHFVRSSRPASHVKITASDCPLFEGPLPHQDWIARFSLAPCRVSGEQLEIRIESDVLRPPNDRRELGVAIRSILLDEI